MHPRPIALLAATLLLSSCHGSSPTGSGQDRADVVLSLSATPLTASALARPETPDAIDWTGRFTLTVRETAGLGVRIDLVRRTLRDTATAAVLGTVALDAAAIASRFGSNRIAARSALDLPMELEGLGFTGTPATLTIDVQFTDDASHPLSRSRAAAVTLLPPPQPLSPTAADLVRQNDPTTGCPFSPTHGYGYRVLYDWSDVIAPAGTDGYELWVRHETASIPALETFVAVSEHTWMACNTYTSFETGWRWRVRTRDRMGNVSRWSAAGEVRFESCASAGVPGCR